MVAGRSDRVYATYRIETAFPIEEAAAIMAGEQSVGTFVRVPGETDDLRAQHGAQVERITELKAVDEPTLPGSKLPKPTVGSAIYQRAEVVLSFPLENMGTNMPVLMSTVAGNLFELGIFSGLRLLDVTIPPAFADVYPGPQFGVAGTRELSGVYNRPLIGTIVKPSVGLTPEQTASLVRTLCQAGLDFIKDDELMGDSPHSPLQARVEAVMRVINDEAQRTGKKLMYAFNISGELDTMLRHHDFVRDHGGTCVMVNLFQVGLVGVAYLRKHAELPIHGHRNGWGMFSRQPYLGMEYTAYQKFLRLAGVDHLNINGLRNKFAESDASVVAAARAVMSPLLGGYEAMVAFSSGQWAGQAPDTYAAIQSADVIHLAGGGIMAHPNGPAAGVVSMQQGWEAAVRGIPLTAFARDHTELRQAMDKYGDAR